MTPAEELRRAAATIRERAEAATPGPWENSPTDLNAPELVYDAKGVAILTAWEVTADAHHVWTWQPSVALAVAAWLESAADHRDSRYDLGDSCDDCEHDALALARLINGGTS